MDEVWRCGTDQDLVFQTIPAPPASNIAITPSTYLEGLDELLLGVGILHLTGHQGQELREVNGTVTISIDLVDHVLQLSFRRVLTYG